MTNLSNGAQSKNQGHCFLILSYEIHPEELVMKKIYVKVSLIAILLLPICQAQAINLHGAKHFKAVLRGLEEVPANSTTGIGTFQARLDPGETTLTFELSYSGLEGTGTVAHVHLGQRDVNGGISFFLCGGESGQPACPLTEGTVSGTVTAEDVIGPEGQGIAPGEFAEIIAAMRQGIAYANVHTDKHPGGEIRGQIKASRQVGLAARKSKVEAVRIK
jgi:hypothetical protein